MKVVFRAATVGSGHAMRCKALAEALKARGAETVFVKHEIEPCDWLVVDDYELGAEWERAQRRMAKKIMAIDDLGREHDCDLLLDQNVLSPANPYAGRVPSHARVFLGPRYALLRPEFARVRERAAPRSGGVRRILVCFGGADPANHTAAALEALRPYAARLERIDVVLGAASRVLGEPKNAVIHPGTAGMATLLAEADLAIGAGGTMAWERACLGVPTLAFGIAPNQAPVLEALFEAGCATGVTQMPQPDAAAIAAWVAAVLSNATLLHGMGKRSRDLVDGRGAERIADALLGEPIRFRRASAADSEAILRWRNDPEVRAKSLDNRTIDARTHATWMQRVLADPKRVLLIAEDARGPVGVVRFDLDGAEAEISVYRTPGPAARPRGLIRAASAWLAQNHPEVATVTAQVLPENAGSLAAFREAGYSDWKHVLRRKNSGD